MKTLLVILIFLLFGKGLLIQGSIEQVVGIAFTEFGLYAAVEAVPSLNNTFFKE